MKLPIKTGNEMAKSPNFTTTCSFPTFKVMPGYSKVAVMIAVLVIASHSLIASSFHVNAYVSKLYITSSHQSSSFTKCINQNNAKNSQMQNTLCRYKQLHLNSSKRNSMQMGLFSNNKYRSGLGLGLNRPYLRKRTPRFVS